jgi:hypothetical protein
MKEIFATYIAVVALGISAANAQSRPIKKGKVKKSAIVNVERTVLDYQLQGGSVVLKIHEKNNPKSDPAVFVLTPAHIDALDTLKHGDVLVLRGTVNQLQAKKEWSKVTFKILPDGREAHLNPETLLAIVRMGHQAEMTKAVHTKKRVPRSKILRNGGLFLLMGVIMLLAAAFRLRLFGVELPREKRGKPASDFNRVFTAVLGLLVCFLSVFYMVVKLFDIQP